MYDTHIFEFKNTKIHYSKKGTGKKIIIAFHGFGLNHKAFDAITDQLTTAYTIYSFDLFFHGKSHWNDQPVLTKPFWKKLMATFCEQNRITNFSMLCFSLGGKFALATLEAMPDKIERLFMIAPDGIKTSIWYNLATYPLIFQNYFKSLIVKPSRFFNLVSFFKKLRLMDKGILKFAASQMNTIKKRRRVYYSWVVFKHLTFDLDHIASLINQNVIGFDIFLGAYDKIITPDGMKKILNKLNHYDLHMVESGHNDLIKNISHRPDLIAEF